LVTLYLRRIYTRYRSELMAAGLAKAQLHGDETIGTPYGEIVLEHGYITDQSSQSLFDALDFQRAAQAYVWSTPLVSFTTWRIEENETFDAGELGTFVILRSLAEKRGIVTGNLTTPYIFQFASLADGAIVVEYPAGATAGGLISLPDFEIVQ
jgi:hypothetical protein